MAFGAFCHRPSALGAIERHIDRAMIFSFGRPALAGAGVIGREHTAHKSNDRQAVLAIIADRINIPPAITIVRNGYIKARSASRASAARIPASVAMGTPGPGCVLPPAR